jgi:hypothetical protein
MQNKKRGRLTFLIHFKEMLRAFCHWVVSVWGWKSRLSVSHLVPPRERESSRVGCSAVLTFARVPLCLPVGSWWEFRLQCVLLYLVIDPADQNHRGLAGTLSSICDGGESYLCDRHPLPPCKSSPPRGRSAGRFSALRTVVPDKQQGFSYLSFCQCL